MELASKNRVCVRIAGNEYTLCSNESLSIYRGWHCLLTKMSEIMQANHTLSTSMASVLTAVNVVDELSKP